MQRIKIILLLLLLPALVKAQTIRAIVSKQLIVADESFTIQYILEDFKNDDEFIPPGFKGFQPVSGPDIYNGSVTAAGGVKSVKNFKYTLVALRPGRFIIKGPKVKVNNKIIQGGDVFIDVITEQEAFEKFGRKGKQDESSEYFLQPGEDPNEKMKKNLFMKVMVDKTSCYIGQPVVATFKLYSRLESKSDIVKNPGFYGFTVYDIINLNDNATTTESIDGRYFDVHTIRSVQLYPLQAGIFTIDAMEVINKVEFSKSAVYKKTEQGIVEGVVEDKDVPSKNNTVVYENNISTEKITIHVKPYPDVKKPVAFNGATGNFFINASLEKNDLAKNEEGALLITISGKGNFTQLPAPSIQWPEQIETFDAIIKDSLDKRQAPLKGSRTFRFPFVANKAGSYSIPAVSFSFFDPDSNKYKTISASLPEITISNEEIKNVAKKEARATSDEKKDNGTIWLYGTIAFVVLIIIVVQLVRPNKEEPVKKKLEAIPEPAVSIEQLLQPVQLSLTAGDGHFYSVLQKIIWDVLGIQLKLSGSKMNKDDLYKAMKKKNINEDHCKEVLDILKECEAAVFTKAEFTNDKQQLLDRAKDVLALIKG